MPKKQTRKYTKATKTKPLTIAIHGEGIAIDAIFNGAKGSNLADAIASVAKQVAVARAPLVPGAALQQRNADLAGVNDIIEYSDNATLMAIVDLALAKLGEPPIFAQTAPAQPNGTA